MKDHLKKVLIDNAATSSTVSKMVQQKEAVMTEEMSFAMQAMESISAEQDLGPFFGLPSKVKNLILRLKGIQDLYGKFFISFPFKFFPYWHLVNVSVLNPLFSFDFRVAEDVFEPGFRATKEKSHLFFTNKWRKDSSGRDSHM